MSPGTNWLNFLGQIWARQDSNLRPGGYRFSSNKVYVFSEIMEGESGLGRIQTWVIFHIPQKRCIPGLCKITHSLLKRTQINNYGENF